MEPAPDQSVPAGRYLGIDLGSRRVGIAVSDPDAKVATALTVVDRKQVPLARRLDAIIEEYEVLALVVGLPRREDGSLGPAAESARDEAAQLESELGIRVHLYDERYSTRIAAEAARAAGVSRRKLAKKGSIDMLAATVILQGFLDRRRSAGNVGS